MQQRRRPVTYSAKAQAWLDVAYASLPAFVHHDDRDAAAASMAQMYAAVAGRPTIAEQVKEANRWRSTGSGLWKYDTRPAAAGGTALIVSFDPLRLVYNPELDVPRGVQ